MTAIVERLGQRVTFLGVDKAPRVEFELGLSGAHVACVTVIWDPPIDRRQGFPMNGRELALHLSGSHASVEDSIWVEVDPLVAVAHDAVGHRP